MLKKSFSFFVHPQHMRMLRISAPNPIPYPFMAMWVFLHVWSWYGLVYKEAVRSERKDIIFLKSNVFMGRPNQVVKRGTVQVDNGNVTFETGYTYTNMVLIQLGCTIH